MCVCVWGGGGGEGGKGGGRGGEERITWVEGGKVSGDLLFIFSIQSLYNFSACIFLSFGSAS